MGVQRHCWGVIHELPPQPYGEQEMGGDRAVIGLSNGTRPVHTSLRELSEAAMGEPYPAACRKSPNGVIVMRGDGMIRAQSLHPRLSAGLTLGSLVNTGFAMVHS